MRMWMCFFFFFNDTATTEIYTLSLHDALPIYMGYSNIENVRQGKYFEIEINESNKDTAKIIIEEKIGRAHV